MLEIKMEADDLSSCIHAYCVTTTRTTITVIAVTITITTTISTISTIATTTTISTTTTIATISTISTISTTLWHEHLPFPGTVFNALTALCHLSLTETPELQPGLLQVG